jgi:hypothetical protein
MTLGDFLDVIANNPLLVLGYFSLIPLTALLAWILSGREGHLSPWKYLYCFLIYMSCIPGIFAVAFGLYYLLIDRGSIMNLDMYMTVIPFLSMLLTLFFIRRSVNLDAVPGFDKIGGLLIMIFVLISFFWVLTRVRIWAVTYIPVHYFGIMFVGLLLMLVYGWRRLFG